MKANSLISLFVIPLATACSSGKEVKYSIEGREISAIECSIHSAKPVYIFDYSNGELLEYNSEEKTFVPLKNKVLGYQSDYTRIKSYSSELNNQNLTVKTYIYFDNNPQKQYDLTTEQINLRTLKVKWFHQHGNEKFQGISNCTWIKKLNNIQAKKNQENDHHKH